MDKANIGQGLHNTNTVALKLTLTHCSEAGVSFRLLRVTACC